MIDLNKAAQSAESLGWTVRFGIGVGQNLTATLGKTWVTLFGDGGLSMSDTYDVMSLTDIAPLIAAWAELAAGGTDGH